MLTREWAMIVLKLKMILLCLVVCSFVGLGEAKRAKCR